MAEAVQIMLISGSLRSGSTNTALLRTALVVAPDGIHPVLYDSLARLPHFNPGGNSVPHPAVTDLLDWTVGGGETYGMPVTCR